MIHAQRTHNGLELASDSVIYGAGMLPITVLLPTRNSMALLPGHIGTMRSWLDLVEEVVIVDSQSDDGTKDLLKRELAGGNVRFFDHPPGLYQSWNHGIQQARSRYLYVSTVGDAIRREGIISLHGLAEDRGCDVVISPPAIVDEAGRPARANPWPVHDLIAHLGLKSPLCLEGMACYFFALSFIPRAILGSSASNLYRTETLQAHPFPCDFGMNGDGAWGLANALDLRLGILPDCVSFFRLHRKPYRRADYYVTEPERRMLDLAFASLHQAVRRRPELEAEAARWGLERFSVLAREVQRWQSTIHWHRSLPWPWVLNLFAWRARHHRDAAQRSRLQLFGSMLRART